MKYKNRIGRKRFVSKSKRSAKKYTKKTIKAIKSFIESFDSLDTVIYKQIKEGLDYGFSPRYYINKNTHHSSIEVEYEKYHGTTASFETYKRQFEGLSFKVIPYRFSHYKDIEIIRDEDECGRYFEVRMND